MARRISGGPNKEPLVSVVTPVFNRPLAIIECTHALTTQTYQNWEQIIIDDKSTDETKDVLSSATDFRIRVFRNDTNIGVAESYSRGFKEARGDIVILNDSDDISFPDRIEKIVRKFQETGADVVYHGMYLTLPHQEYGFPVYAYKEAQEFSIKRLRKEQYIPAVVGVRKEFAQKFKADKKYSGSWDWHFLLDLANQGAKFEPLNEALYLYRRHNNSLSVQNEQAGRREKSIANIRRYIRQAKGLG